MELICPLCNGLFENNYKCEKCHGAVDDVGPIVNYLDDYSPYLSNDITQLVDGVAHDKCLHLYKCNSCDYDKRVEVNRVRM